MKTLQFTTHIENNAQLHLTLPAEYANQDVELVVIIQSSKETMNERFIREDIEWGLHGRE